MKKTSGFSLIELLVVVVIIGVLAAAGFVAYQGFIDSSRDRVTEDNFEFLKRTLDNDILSVANDLSARSKFSDNLTGADECYVLRDRYISEINASKTNPFNAAVGQVCDGNHFASYNNGLTSPETVISINRGRTMVYCDGKSINDASYKTISGKIGMKFCTCLGQETCATTRRYKGTLATAVVAGDASAVVTPLSADDDETSRFLLTPASKLLVGAEVVNIDVVLDAANDTFSLMGAFRQAHAAATPVFEVNEDQCFMPVGEASASAYESGAWSELASGSALDPKHRCY